MAYLDLETAREYVRAHQVWVFDNEEVCVDGRNPQTNAGKLARGGATLGRYLDVIESLDGLEISDYPAEAVFRQMIEFSQSNALGKFISHTDDHSILKPESNSIGCKYIAVAMEKNAKLREVALKTLNSSNLVLDVLHGKHQESAVIIDEGELYSFPHQAEGVMVFKYTRIRDEKRMQELINHLRIPGLYFGDVNKVVQRNLNQTLVNIPEAIGLPVYRAFRTGGNYELEQIGKVGS